MSYTIKRNAKYEARIYIGSRRGYNGPKITKKVMKFSIKMYQTIKGLEKASPVRLTPTTYLWQDYEEKGWEIGIINYPRRPLGPLALQEYAMDLAAYLLEEHGQNRISIEFPDETVMLEADDAEQKHK